MAENVRVYATVFADFPAGSVSDVDWRTLLSAAKTQPLSAAILEAARGRGAQAFITAAKRSQNAAFLRLYTMLGFEVDRAEVAALTAVLDAQTVIHGVTGNMKAKLEGVLQAEFRAAAAGLGYTPTQQSKLQVGLVNGDVPNTFDRDMAIQQAQAYLATNATIWYE